MAGGEQKMISMKSKLQELSLDTQASDENEEETHSALLEYVFQRANRDNALSGDQARTFQNAQQDSGREEATPAAMVGRRLAELGDEIDAQYHDEMEEIVRMTESPETAFAMFHDIVRNLFEWDENGAARINIGRIAALLAYCYHLCKTYISTHFTSSYGLLSFLAMVSGWLFQFLIKAKFYEWLQKQGGWGQLVALSTSGWGKHAFLIIGIASIAIWAFGYFRSK